MWYGHDVSYCVFSPKRDSLYNSNSISIIPESNALAISGIWQKMDRQIALSIQVHDYNIQIFIGIITVHPYVRHFVTASQSPDPSLDYHPRNTSSRYSNNRDTLYSVRRHQGTPSSQKIENARISPGKKKEPIPQLLSFHLVFIARQILCKNTLLAIIIRNGTGLPVQLLPWE